jgi:hypothetical protein
MVVKGIVKTGAYFDSVTLMIVGRELSAKPGVRDAAVVMGTAENLAILKASGLLCPELSTASDTDLLIGVKAEDESSARSALAEAESLLKSVRKRAAKDSSYAPKSLDGALGALPGANLALVSVAAATPETWPEKPWRRACT